MATGTCIYEVMFWTSQLTSIPLTMRLSNGKENRKEKLNSMISAISQGHKTESGGATSWRMSLLQELPYREEILPFE